MGVPITKPRVHAAGSLLEQIGNTPLIRLAKLDAGLPGIEILAKAEFLNPGGSVKDRAAANIVAQGRRNGTFAPGKILLDATSGNTGIAYAMARHLSRNAGLLVGISSAAAVVGCLKIARELRLKRDQESVIVTILCDSGDKYLSERFWTEG